MNAKTFLVFLIGLVVVILLGYVDYLTGAFSLDPLYLLVIFAVTWFAGTGCGLLCVVEVVGVEAVADYYSEMGQAFSALFIWNWATDLIVFSAFCLLVGIFRRKVSRDTQ